MSMPDDFRAVRVHAGSDLTRAEESREIVLDSGVAHLLGLTGASIRENATYTYKPPHPHLNNLIAEDGTKLGAFGDASQTVLAMWTKVRAVDQPSGVVTCFWTVEFYTFGTGYVMFQNGSFHVAMLNAAGAVLLDWDLTYAEATVSCSDNAVCRFARRDFRPDLYNDAAGARIYIPGKTEFRHC